MNAMTYREVTARIVGILERVRRVRQNCYPGGWNSDPLYGVEQGLQSLIIDMKNNRDAEKRGGVI